MKEEKDRVVELIALTVCPIQAHTGEDDEQQADQKQQGIERAYPGVDVCTCQPQTNCNQTRKECSEKTY